MTAPQPPTLIEMAKLMGLKSFSEALKLIDPPEERYTVFAFTDAALANFWEKKGISRTRLKEFVRTIIQDHVVLTNPGELVASANPKTLTLTPLSKNNITAIFSADGRVQLKKLNGVEVEVEKGFHQASDGVMLIIGQDQVLTDVLDEPPLDEPPAGGKADAVSRAADGTATATSTAVGDDAHAQAHLKEMQEKAAEVAIIFAKSFNLAAGYILLAFVGSVALVTAWTAYAFSGSNTLKLCIAATALHIITYIAVVGLYLLISSRMPEDKEELKQTSAEEMESTKNLASIIKPICYVAFVLVVGVVAMASAATHMSRG